MQRKPLGGWQCCDAEADADADAVVLGSVQHTWNCLCSLYPYTIEAQRRQRRRCVFMCGVRVRMCHEPIVVCVCTFRLQSRALDPNTIAARATRTRNVTHRQRPRMNWHRVGNQSTLCTRRANYSSTGRDAMSLSFGWVENTKSTRRGNTPVNWKLFARTEAFDWSLCNGHFRLGWNNGFAHAYLVFFHKT